MKNLIILVAAVLGLSSCGKEVTMKVEKATTKFHNTKVGHEETIKYNCRGCELGDTTSTEVNGVVYWGVIVK